VIPVFNHGRTIAAVVENAQQLNLPVIVVDDGSTDETHDRVRSLGGVRLLRHHCNLGNPVLPQPCPDLFLDRERSLRA